MKGTHWFGIGALIVTLALAGSPVALAEAPVAHEDAFGGGEYGPDQIPAEARARFAKLDGRRAGMELSFIRETGNVEGFARHFVLFLDQGRSTSQILAMLRVIGLPLREAEVEAIGEIAMSVPMPIRHRNCVEHGYHLDVHCTPGTRLQLTFLNDEEKAAYRKWAMHEGKIETEREKAVVAELEGRMCVWASDRKIHLGGPHFVYDRAARILGHP